MNKVTIIGHFGVGKDLVNGQTIKTKIIADELKKKYNDIIIIDTHGGIKRIFSLIKNIKEALKKSENIIILPAHNGIKIIVPILSFYNRNYKRKLHYIVIGGWLCDFLEKYKYLTKLLKKFQCIYVETNVMKNKLEILGFTNIVIMPNCKKINIIDKKMIDYNIAKKPFRICTLSRVMKEKGIEDIIKSIIEINNKYKKTIYKLDIYGQIDNTQNEWFNDLKKSFPDYIKYCGVVDYNKTTDILKEYFFLIFPTKFYTEGIPGTIIDSYASALPVVSSKWESFNDVIKEGITGYGYDFNDTECLISLLEKINKNPLMITELKNNCIKEATKYTVENGLNTLYENIE